MIQHSSNKPSCQCHPHRLLLPSRLPRQSNCIRTAPQCLGYNNTQGHGYFASPSAWIFEENGIILSPTAFKATTSDPDILSFDQAMADIEHATKWMEAAAKEEASLERNGTWKKSVCLKPRQRFSQRTWLFQRKQSSDGEITKYQGALLCSRRPRRRRA